MNRVDRKILLIRAGINQSEIARRVGVSKATVCRVVAGIQNNERVKAQIAHLLEMRVDELWPSKEEPAVPSTGRPPAAA